MKNTFLFLLLIYGVSVFAQQQSSKIPKQDFYFGVNGGVELNAIEVFKKKQNNWEQPVLADPYFGYLISAQVGYHFIPQLSLEGGLRYNYISKNIHPVYFMVHPKVYFNVDDERPLFLGLYYGNKINRTTVDAAKVFGLDFGQMNPIFGFANFTPSFFIENHQLNGDSHWFLGIKVGVQIFSGSNSY